MLDIEALVRHKGLSFKYGQGSNGTEIKITCPICGGKYKLWCSLTDEICFCHRCRWGTDNPELLVRYLINCNPFVAALLCNKFQKQKPYKSLDECVHEAFDGHIYDFPEEFEGHRTGIRPLPIPENKTTPPLELPEHYYPLGDPRIPMITKYAFTRRFSFKLLVEYRFGGCPVGRYRGSLILPAYHGDTLMFWQARDAIGRNYDEFPKYRTPPGYSSAQALFNIDKATQHETVILCEGVFSAMRTGVDAVATFGNKITDEQCLLLQDRGIKNVVLCFDPDTWHVPKAMLDRGIVGMKPPIYHAMMKVIDYFEHVRVAKLIDGDPDDLGTAKVRKVIDESTPVVDYSDVVKIMM